MHRKKLMFNWIPKIKDRINKIAESGVIGLFEISPATIGLRDFSGWSISFSLSIKSLIIYINQEEKAKLMMPIIESNNNVVIALDDSPHQ